MEDVNCFKCNELLGKITDSAPRGMIYCIPCAEEEEREEEEAYQQSLEENEDYYNTLEIIEENS